MLTEGTATGPNVMYFETGQGSELSSDAHFGADQVTMEARCYGFAREFSHFMVINVTKFYKKIIGLSFFSKRMFAEAATKNA